MIMNAWCVFGSGLRIATPHTKTWNGMLFAQSSHDIRLLISNFTWSFVEP